MSNKGKVSLFIGAWILTAMASSAASAAEAKVRVGHYPNLTHAQALVGRASGWFESRVQSPIEWKVFNAGPIEMEALLANAIDLGYVGPNPALNAYLRSGGTALKIVAGAASGGAALVTRKEANLKSPSDFRGKRVASPELGNTQDVALRHWLKTQGLQPGKDVQVIPIKNPDILTLFQRKELDAAWVPEPWVTRLIQEGGGTLFLDERDLWPDGRFSTAVLVVRAEFLKQHPDLVRQFIAAHQELTDWIHEHPEESRNQLNETLSRLSGKPLPPELVQEALGRMEITYDPLIPALLTVAGWAQELNYLPRSAQVSNLSVFDLSLLNEVLLEHKRPTIHLPSDQEENR